MSKHFKTMAFLLFALSCGWISHTQAQDNATDNVFVSKKEDGRVLQLPPRHQIPDTLLTSPKDDLNSNIIILDDLGNDGNESYTFSEGQLGEDEDFAGTTAMVSSNDDYFLSEVGYRFSSVRFRNRAYHAQYNNVYANGVLMNDVERGQFSYGLIGGLNDATRNKEGATFTEHNSFGFSTIGGASNINMRASQYAAGHKASIVGCNRNYLARLMYTYSTGLMRNGWAFTASASYRWANEGVIEGTFYNSAAYFFAAEKKINERHSISIATWGSPTERAQQAAATEEAYWLAGSHYYNSNWGYQNGKKRNARVVNSYEPSAIVTWDFQINDKVKLTTSLFGKYSMYSTSALGWNGNAADPRPNYYKNLPSAAYDVWDLEYKPTDDELADFNNLYNYWTSSKANRQLNWDYMYFANQQANAVGGECLYYVENRHNDQLTLNLGSTLNIDYDKNNKGTIGLNLGTTKGMHYKTMNDLMGAEKYTDIDKFSVGDFGANSSYVQNDVDNPNRQIREGDVFGYDYDLYVNKANLFYQHRFSKGIFNLFAGANVEGTTIERFGNMRNGRAQGFSKGSSGTAYFLGGGAKLGIVLPFNAHHTLSFGGGYENRAPLAYNSFIAPRMRNNFVIGLTNENLLNAEASYQLTYGPVTAKATGYYTLFKDLVEQNAFYNDQQSKFTYLTMTGVDKVHYGIEAAIVYNITSSLSINVMASVGNAEYWGNANGFLISESEEAVTNDKVYLDGVKVDGTPLTALSLGADYNVNGWYLSANVNYFDNIYIDASNYARLASVVGEPVIDATTGEEKLDIPAQYRGKGGFMVDASIGKNINLRGGNRLNINLSLNNILNNQKMITGGYEQNRDDSYSDGSERTYKFSKNPFLYYANAFNAYLNIGFRF